MKENIKKGMEVIGADGVHVGKVEEVHGHRIRLNPKDNARGHENHQHYIELGLVAGIEGHQIRLSANANIAVTFEEEESGKPV